VNSAELTPRLSDVLKRRVTVIKSRAIVKCSSKETFGSLISKIAPEFQEERVKTKVLFIFQFQKFI